MVTALSCAEYCKGALNLILSFDSASLPPCDTEEVETVMFENNPMLPAGVNVLAPLDNALLVTIYSIITILPFDNFLPSIPSPKVTQYLPVSVSFKK